MTALPSPTRATSVGTFVPISSGSMSSWMMRTSSRKRGRAAEVEDPVEARAEQHDEVGVAEHVGAGGGGVVGRVGGDDASAHRRGEPGDAGFVDEFLDFLLGLGPGHAFADDDEGVGGGLERLDRGLDVLAGDHRASGFLDGGGPADFAFVDFGVDDVAGQVEVDGAGAAVDRGRGWPGR